MYPLDRQPEPDHLPGSRLQTTRPLGDLVISSPMDTCLNMLGMAAMTLLLVALARRRIYRTFPAFTVLICSSLVIALTPFVTNLLPESKLSSRLYLLASVILVPIDVAVLVELTWRVLRSRISSVPQISCRTVTIGIILIGCLMAVSTGLIPQSAAEWPSIVLLKLDNTVALLTVFVVVAVHFAIHRNRSRHSATRIDSDYSLAGKRHDREFHIATGLGLSSLAGLASPINQLQGNITLITMAQMRMAHSIERVLSLIWIGVIVYWIIVFSCTSLKMPPTGKEA